MKIKKILAVLLTAAMVVTPITGAAYNTGETEWTTDQTSLLKLYATSSISTFNWLCSANGSGRKSQSNWIDPLVLVDADNNYIPGIAESWETNEDDSVWTFYLRDDATWVDYEGNYKADVVADDFLYGLEWVLNYWKNSGVNTSLPCSMIKGAQEYYDYTRSLSEEEGLALGIDEFCEMVEIDEPDEHTLVYNLISPTVYFTSVLTSNSFWPLSGAMIDEIGVDGFLTATYDTIWYCGPYTISRFVDGNTEVFSKNESYWNKDALVYDEIQRTIVESGDVALQLYEQGDVDRVQLSSAQISYLSDSEWYDHIVREKASGTIWYVIFNFDKKNQDGTEDADWNKAAANEAFRQAIYYGCDFTNYLAYTDPMDPLSQINMTISPYSMVKFSDGSDYTDRVLDLIGLDRDVDTYPHMEADLAAEYKAEAMEELEAEGVTFPINIDLWCGSSQSDQDTYTILKEILENGLGTDFVTVTLNTYVTSATEEYIAPGYYSLALDGNGLDYMDPYAVLRNLDITYEEAALVNDYGNVNDCDSEDLKSLFTDLSDMIADANAMIDLDERYEAFAQAEAYVIDHALLLPMKGNKGLALYNYNMYSGASMLSDGLNGRLDNLEYKEGGYSTEDYELFERRFKGLE